MYKSALSRITFGAPLRCRRRFPRPAALTRDRLRSLSVVRPRRSAPCARGRVVHTLCSQLVRSACSAHRGGMPIRSVPNDPDRQSWTGRSVSLRPKWTNGRYEDDPEFRQRKRAWNTAYRAQHRVEINARRRRRRREDPDNREKQRASRYGLSLQEVREMLARQNSACAICKKSDRRLVLDHCHVTGRVRAFLCYGCNSGLGCYNDDPSLTDGASAYLRSFA